MSISTIIFRFLSLCVLLLCLPAYLFHGSNNISNEYNNDQQNVRILDTAKPISGVLYYTEYYYADSQCSQLYFLQSLIINQCYMSSNAQSISTMNYDYAMNTLLSLGTNNGYLLTQTYYNDQQCTVLDNGNPPQVNYNTPTQCQAVNSGVISGFGNLFVIASISSSPPSTSGGGITIKGYGQIGCSGNPQELSYYVGNAAGTLTSAMSTCLGIFQGVCGINSIGVSTFAPTYPVSSAKCTSGTALVKLSYPISCTAKGFIGQGMAYYGIASCSDPPTAGAAAAACFADTEMVQLEVLPDSASKKYIPLRDVQIGDRILTVNNQGHQVYSPVVYLPHGQNNDRTTFMILTTESGRDVKMTRNHYLPGGACSSPNTLPMIVASQVMVGDCVETVSGREQVVSVEKVEGKGIFTVITMEELIVVNDIVATPFGGVNPTVANIYYNFHRLVYAISFWQYKSSSVLTSMINSNWLQGTMEKMWRQLSIL